MLGNQLSAFVRGEFMDYYGVDMRRLCPAEKDIWEIKSVLKPQLRLLGWFVLPKWFVAVHPIVRDDVEKKKGPKCDAAIEKAERLRAELVGHVSYFSDNPGDYVRNPT